MILFQYTLSLLLLVSKILFSLMTFSKYRLLAFLLVSCVSLIPAPDARDVIEQSIEIMNNLTCVKFDYWGSYFANTVPHRNYVKFFSGSWVASAIIKKRSILWKVFSHFTCSLFRSNKIMFFVFFYLFPSIY